MLCDGCGEQYRPEELTETDMGDLCPVCLDLHESRHSRRRPMDEELDDARRGQADWINRRGWAL